MGDSSGWKSVIYPKNYTIYEALEQEILIDRWIIVDSQGMALEDNI